MINDRAQIEGHEGQSKRQRRKWPSKMAFGYVRPTKVGDEASWAEQASMLWASMDDKHLIPSMARGRQQWRPKSGEKVDAQSLNSAAAITMAFTTAGTDSVPFPLASEGRISVPGGRHAPLLLGGR